MIKDIRPMTEEEKRNIFLLVAPPELHHEIDQWSHGEGMSIFFDNEWIGGIAFLAETNLLVGGVKPEYVSTGQWIAVWGQLIKWAHSIHTEIIMECANEDVADLFMKLGGKNKKTRDNCWQVDFTKSYTEEFLQNNDLRSIG